MIRTLRHRHRQIFFGLVVLLPMLFISGLLARRPMPVVNQNPGTNPPPADRRDLIDWAEAGLRLGPTAEALDVVPMGAGTAPDLLLYWSQQPPEGGVIDPAALLLGSVDGVRSQRFTLPAPAREADGYLIAWSLAHQHQVAVRAWPKGGGR